MPMRSRSDQRVEHDLRLRADPCRRDPTNKEQCKNGGWRDFTDPAFKNQGQCVSFVVSKRCAAKTHTKRAKHKCVVTNMSITGPARRSTPKKAKQRCIARRLP